MATLLVRRQFTVTDYGRMRETGILTEDDRVELLDGEVYVMSPIGPLHVAIVNRLNRLLMHQLKDETIVSIQNPIHLDDYSEPQPDITLLRAREDTYATALATADDVFVLIEVADTSITYDRDQKLPRYAAANIQEVWIVDVEHQMIEQYTQPVTTHYTRISKILFGDVITSTTLPSIQIRTDRVF